MQEFMEMKQAGLSIQAISELTGCDRKTVRKHLLEPEAVPSYGPRAAQSSKLDAHKSYLEDRLKAGVWNAQVLFREIRQRGYRGGCTILKDWMQPQRAAGMATAVRRFETPPGKQAQVDWGHLGYLETGGGQRQVWGFAITLGWVAPHGVASPTFAFGVLLALLVIVRHRDNIVRLARGEERRFSFKRGGAA